MTRMNDKYSRLWLKLLVKSKEEKDDFNSNCFFCNLAFIYTNSVANHSLYFFESEISHFPIRESYRKQKTPDFAMSEIQMRIPKYHVTWMALPWITHAHWFHISCVLGMAPRHACLIFDLWILIRLSYFATRCPIRQI